MSTDLLAWDREHLWHPYTSMAAPTPVRLVTGASGAQLRVSTGSTTDEAREVVDGMASWWTAIHGYRHPVLDAAVQDQLGSMSHVMFGGLTHEPAIGLARRLVDITPDGLEHVFLADSGSVSVEVALKMAMQYQRGRGRTGRTRMLTVRGGYHGDTCGCMGVCDPDGGMHATWRGFLPEHVFAPRPPRARGTSPSYDARVDDHEHDAALAAWTTAFERTAKEHAGELAGIIVEPLLQGAGGMHPYDAECLRVMRRVADAHDLVLVCDEIATGFGRTGTLFACEAAGVVPDVLCLGKALTGGYLTLAAALCTREVAHTISRSEAGVLMHGPTFMGNPLACTVASASIDLLLADDWASTVARVGRGLRSGLAACADLRAVVDVRTLGAVGVVELDHDVDVVKATEAALDEGVWLRPFRNLVYTMPPYVASDDEVAAICRGVRAAADVG